MLNNTIAHCHTLGEILAGGGMGIAILLAAHLISKHTPLGEYVKKGVKLGRAKRNPEEEDAYAQKPFVGTRWV
jgi:hypothetical protein